jgi:pSer/pThr/pTyr-binding forkhead associated (FHA) protein
MNARLVIQSGARGKRVVRLQCEETIIGRRHDCDLRIPSNDVSRRHCLLSMHDGQLNVEDLDSVNGTFVNGRRISGRQIVMPGDELQVGPVSFVAQYEMAKSASSGRDDADGASEDADAIDVLPLADEDTAQDVLTVGDDEDLAVLEVVEDGDTAVPTKAYSRPNMKKRKEDKEEEEVLELVAEDDVEDAIPLTAEFLEEEDWHAPVEGDLRNILSEMDNTTGSKKRKSED